MRRRLCRSGLTLLELVLVLVILTTVATLAVEMLEPQVDQHRFESSQKTIQNVDNAIFAEKTSSEGTVYYSGFVVDLGDLPRAVATGEVNQAGQSLLSLIELWQVPMRRDGTAAPMALFSLRPADYATLANTDTASDGDKNDLDEQRVYGDAELSIGTGWQGPYLKLPIGSNVLHDGWGHRLTSVVSDATQSHLRGEGDTDIAAAGEAIYGVRSFGRHDVPDSLTTPSDDYDRDIPAGLSLTGGKLQGSVTGRVRTDSSEATSANLVVQLYYPDAATGLIRVERATVQLVSSDPDTGEQEFSFQFQDSNGATLEFPVGPRALRAYLNHPGDDTDDFSDGSTGDPAGKSRIVHFTLRPTVNARELRIQ